MKNLTIAVTGLNNIDSPGPGVGVIRALRDSPDFQARIIGLSYDNLEPGIYMHELVDHSYQVPFPSLGSDMLKARLKYIHEREKIDVIIPTFDTELLNYIKISKDLQEWGIHTFLPTADQLRALDKLHLFEFGKKNGLRVPKTTVLEDTRSIPQLRDAFDYPLMVKGKYYEAYIARNESEVYPYFFKITAKWGLPILIQEFVEGTEIDIAGLGDGNGKVIGAVPMRKLYITDKGKGWAGITLHDEKLLDFTTRFIKASKWRSGFELEIMRGKEDDELYLMEINPRFPAWIYTTAAAGQNLPAALVLLALGKKVKPYKDYEVGKIFIRYSWDLITDINEFQEIAMTGEL